nr:nuclear receptor coactivator 2-like [Pseudochaenichthys georgianus]
MTSSSPAVLSSSSMGSHPGTAGARRYGSVLQGLRSDVQLVVIALLLPSSGASAVVQPAVERSARPVHAPPGGPAVGGGGHGSGEGVPVDEGVLMSQLYTPPSKTSMAGGDRPSAGDPVSGRTNQSLEQDQFQQDSMLMDQKPPMYSQQFAAPPSHLSQRGGYPLQDQGFHPLGGPMGPRPGYPMMRMQARPGLRPGGGVPNQPNALRLQLQHRLQSQQNRQPMMAQMRASQCEPFLSEPAIPTRAPSMPRCWPSVSGVAKQPPAPAAAAAAEEPGHEGASLCPQHEQHNPRGPHAAPPQFPYPPATVPVQAWPPPPLSPNLPPNPQLHMHGSSSSSTSNSSSSTSASSSSQMMMGQYGAVLSPQCSTVPFSFPTQV